MRGKAERSHSTAAGAPDRWTTMAVLHRSTRDEDGRKEVGVYPEERIKSLYLLVSTFPESRHQLIC